MGARHAAGPTGVDGPVHVGSGHRCAVALHAFTAAAPARTRHPGAQRAGLRPRVAPGASGWRDRVDMDRAHNIRMRGAIPLLVCSCLSCSAPLAVVLCK